MDQNVEIYNDYIHEYNDYKLYPAEQIIFGKFEDQWSNFNMLDIGIGTGRTTANFAPLVKHYTGIDYAEIMLRHCRKKIPPSANMTLLQADARDLSQFYDTPFDFIMFSLNGIDSVSHKDRIRILQEIRKLLAKDGYFFFSTHSLRGFKNTRKRPPFKWHSIAKSLYHWLDHFKFMRRMRTHHPDSSMDEIRNKEWAILKTGDHDFKMDIYHIDPVYQLQQLDEAGFEVVSTYNLHGGVVAPETTTVNTIYFLCKAKAG